jgi:bifunctional non-homologous end joining protein LigD
LVYKEDVATRTARKANEAPVLVGGVRVTHPSQVVYPDAGLTKLDVIKYYVAVEERMLPLMRGRPLTVVRCPDGEGKPCFFQKHVERGMPEAVGRVAIREERGTTRDYPVVEDISGLVGLVQMRVLEVHQWGARTDDVEKPDVIVFDLDPDVGLKWSRVVEAAFAMRKKLESLGLESWVKTTGGKGLHVCVPIARRLDWAQIRAFTSGVAESLEREEPAAYTVNARKVRRKGRIFLDYARNGRGATFVCAYSTRARPGATVATPISWDELEKGVDPKDFTVTSVPARLTKKRKDPWKGMLDRLQQITAAAVRAVSGV